jgi:type III secretory pathway component EscS
MEAADVVADTVGIVIGLSIALTPLRDALLHVAGRAR